MDKRLAWKRMKKSAVCLLAVAFFAGAIPFGGSIMRAETPEPETPALEHLLNQAGGQYKDDDKLTFVVQLSEDSRDYRSVSRAYSVSPLQLRSSAGQELQASIARETQREALHVMQEEKIEFHVEKTLRLLLNGFTGEATFAEAKKLARLPQVASVEIATQYKLPEQPVLPLDVSSNEMIGAPDAVNLGYEGQGGVIAILDTGADPEHKDLQLSEEDAAKARYKKSAPPVIEGKKNTWFSSKIPYGYNYYDDDNVIKNLTPGASQHGMHVAGIAAGNGDPKTGGVRGVAPKAQLLIMNVFNASGSTASDIYLPAMEDAITLGADSINMSLGSVTNHVGPDSATEKAIRKAEAMGIVVAVAAGNDGYQGFNPLGKNEDPSAANPDYGMTATPGTDRSALTVGSVNNAKMHVTKFELLSSNLEPIYKIGNGQSLEGLYDKKLEYVFVGLGREQDYKSPITGKVALIERGKIPFAEKLENAKNQGAVLAVIFNNEANAPLLTMDVAGASLPGVFISMEDGVRMKDAYKKELRFSKDTQVDTYPGAGEMSDFSSWGLTQTGDLKPDITAPGGNIYSTLYDNGHGNMSGTSMATPHVAGGIAVVAPHAESLLDSAPNFASPARSALIKHLLMNTAHPHVARSVEGTEVFTSPRWQGAGVMYLPGALQSKVIVTAGEGSDWKTQQAKAVLGNLSDARLSVKLQLYNFGADAVTYSLNYQITTDEVKNGRYTRKPELIHGAELQTVELPAGEPGNPAHVEVPVTLDLTDYVGGLAEKQPNGYFLEGFFTLKPQGDKDGLPQLSLPVVGFRGNWNDIPVLEKPVYDFPNLQENAPLYYDPTSKENTQFTYFFGAIEAETRVLGETTPADAEGGNRSFDREKLAISPNADNRLDQLSVNAVPLRSAELVELRILDSDENIVAVRKEAGVNKPVLSRGETPSRVLPLLKWDGQASEGKQKGKILKDGRYKIALYGRSVGAPENSEMVKISEDPLWIDTKPPTKKQVAYEASTGKLTVAFQDAEAGLRQITVLLDDKPVAAEAEGTYTLPAQTSPNKVEVLAEDYAGNEYFDTLQELLHPTPKVKLTVRALVGGKELSPADYTYDILREREDGSYARVAHDPDDMYRPGNYKLHLSSWNQSYRSVGGDKGRDQKITLTKEGGSVTFELQKDNRDKGFVRVAIENSDSYTGPREIYIINDETGEEFRLSVRYAPIPTMFEGYFIPVGSYRVEARNVSPGWRVVPTAAKLVLERKTGLDYIGPITTIQFVEDKDTGKIQPQLLQGDPGVDLARVQASVYSYALKQDVTNEKVLPFGRYRVSLTLPEEYFAMPAKSEVELTADEKVAKPKFTIYKKSADRVGRVLFDLEKYKPEYSDEVAAEVTYTVRDANGVVVHDLNRLSYGTYTVTASEPVGYLVRPASESIEDLPDGHQPNNQTFEISATQAIVTVKYRLLKISDVGISWGTIEGQVIYPDDYPGYIFLNVRNSEEVRAGEPGKDIQVTDEYGGGDFGGFLDVQSDEYVYTPIKVAPGYVVRGAIENTVDGQSVSTDIGGPPFHIKAKNYIRVTLYYELGYYLELQAEPDQKPLLVPVSKNHPLKRPEDPYRKGYKFLGWVAADTKKPFDFDAKDPLEGHTLKDNTLKLEASWEELPPPMDGGPVVGIPEGSDRAVSVVLPKGYSIQNLELEVEAKEVEELTFDGKKQRVKIYSLRLIRKTETAAGVKTEEVQPRPGDHFRVNLPLGDFKAKRTSVYYFPELEPGKPDLSRAEKQASVTVNEKENLISFDATHFSLYGIAEAQKKSGGGNEPGGGGDHGGITPGSGEGDWSGYIGVDINPGKYRQESGESKTSNPKADAVPKTGEHEGNALPVWLLISGAALLAFSLRRHFVAGAQEK